MGRETSPYIVGDWWLDKRRDGKSPAIWQIASYEPETRSICYRSTRKRELEGPNGAKAVIDAHFEAMRAKSAQAADQAKVIPLLFLYWNEHGQHVVSPDQIANSIRKFIGFLMQDDAGTDVTVAELSPQVFIRFQRWCMGPHSYDVPWGGKDYRHQSGGVKGESVSRYLDDIRAALGHHANEGRLPYKPVVPPVKAELRSPPRDRVLTANELGAIVGFTREDLDTHRWVLLMLATAVRPEAALAFNPAAQWNKDLALLDLHPAAWPRTKKHNPVVPALDAMVPVLEAWTAAKPVTVASRKRAWRTVRRALGLGSEVQPKTIRHSVATRLRTLRVPAEEVETLLGHRVLKKTTAVYAKYDPDYLAGARTALAKIFAEVMAEADRWSAGHLRAKVGNEPTKVLRRGTPEAMDFLAKSDGMGG